MHLITIYHWTNGLVSSFNWLRQRIYPCMRPHLYSVSLVTDTGVLVQAALVATTVVITRKGTLHVVER